MRFHLPGLPHTKTSKVYSPCAFTQNIVKLAGILVGLGHEVIHYGNEGSDVVCTEHVTIYTAAEWNARYAPEDWKEGRPFKEQPAFAAEFNRRAAAAIVERKRDDDVLLLSWGWNQKAIADAAKLRLTVEPGVGYVGTVAPYRVFPSYTWMHFIYGRESVWNNQPWGHSPPLWGDAVIPHHFDVDEFPFRKDKEGFCLFVGRLNLDKGLQSAIEACRVTGNKLLIAGQGDLSKFCLGPHVEYVGVLGHAARNDLMSRAKVFFAPTEYIEPFGCVAVEAMLCGTPVIATDWGAFPETVIDGVTGVRCRSGREFIAAVGEAQQIDKTLCRETAVRMFGLETASRNYKRYFERITYKP